MRSLSEKMPLTTICQQFAKTLPLASIVFFVCKNIFYIVGLKKGKVLKEASEKGSILEKLVLFMPKNVKKTH